MDRAMWSILKTCLTLLQYPWRQFLLKYLWSPLSVERFPEGRALVKTPKTSKTNLKQLGLPSPYIKKQLSFLWCQIWAKHWDVERKRGKRLIIAARNISTDMRSPGNCHGENDSGSWTSEIFRQPHIDAACVCKIRHTVTIYVVCKNIL